MEHSDWSATDLKTQHCGCCSLSLLPSPQSLLILVNLLDVEPIHCNWHWFASVLLPLTAASSFIVFTNQLQLGNLPSSCCIFLSSFRILSGKFLFRNSRIELRLWTRRFDFAILALFRLFWLWIHHVEHSFGVKWDRVESCACDGYRQRDTLYRCWECGFPCSSRLVLPYQWWICVLLLGQASESCFLLFEVSSLNPQREICQSMVINDFDLTLSLLD